jgi:hypothetical protein
MGYGGTILIPRSPHGEINAIVVSKILTLSKNTYYSLKPLSLSQNCYYQISQKHRHSLRNTIPTPKSYHLKNTASFHSLKNNMSYEENVKVK